MKHPRIEIDLTRPRGGTDWFWRIKLRQGVYAVGDARTLEEAQAAIAGALPEALAEWERNKLQLEKR